VLKAASSKPWPHLQSAINFIQLFCRLPLGLEAIQEDRCGRRKGGHGTVETSHAFQVFGPGACSSCSSSPLSQKVCRLQPYHRSTKTLMPMILLNVIGLSLTTSTLNWSNTLTRPTKSQGVSSSHRPPLDALCHSPRRIPSTPILLSCALVTTGIFTRIFPRRHTPQHLRHHAGRDQQRYSPVVVHGCCQLFPVVLFVGNGSNIVKLLAKRSEAFWAGSFTRLPLVHRFLAFHQGDLTNEPVARVCWVVSRYPHHVRRSFLSSPYLSLMQVSLLSQLSRFINNYNPHRLWAEEPDHIEGGNRE